MSLRKWMKTPKAYVAIIMVLYLFLAAYTSNEIKGITNGLIAVVVAFLLDAIFCWVGNRKKIFHDGPVITGLIVALVLGTTSSFFIVAATVAIAIIGKHVLVYKKNPIFNPAALGLFISIIAFKSIQSWWGAFGDSHAWTIIFLLIGGYFITHRINKFPQVFAFLGTSFVMLLIMGFIHWGAVSDAVRTPFINATLFFGFFMLTDPPTSPGKTADQVIFGMMTAVIGTLIFGKYGGLMYLFIGLLIGNLYQFLRRVQTSRAKDKTKANRHERVNRKSRVLS